MKALVVYESMYGNTERIARAVAAGLSPFGEVDLAEVGGAVPSLVGVDLLVVGGPTHAFGMSRESTRKDAEQRGDGPVLSQRCGVREWLTLLPRAAGTSVATFDTKIHKARRMPGCARGAAKALRRRGFTPMASESFFVLDTTGPLVEGERHRAGRWAASLGRRVSAAAGSHAGD
jgi:hypothetical protein